MNRQPGSLFSLDKLQILDPPCAAELIGRDERAAACYREFRYQANSPWSWRVELSGETVSYDYRALAGYTGSGLLVDLRRIDGLCREKPTENFHLLVGNLRTGQITSADIEWLEESPEGDGARLDMIVSLAGDSGRELRAFELTTSTCRTYTEADQRPESIANLLELDYRLAAAAMAK